MNVDKHYWNKSLQDGTTHRSEYAHAPTNSAVSSAKRVVILSGQAEYLQAFGPTLLAIGATLLWAASLRNINIHHMSGLGLVSVLPLTFYVALAILTVAFCLTLHEQRIQTPVLLLHLFALIFMLYATPILVEEVSHGHVPWRHAGYTEYLMRGGELDGRFEFYFNFPGFFVLSALLTSVAGLPNPIHFMAWAPVFFNLLYLGPLTIMLRSATNDKRLVALGLWLFYLANWVGQDHFVPQALTYFLYLVILSILLQSFKTKETQWFTTAVARLRFGSLMPCARPFAGRLMQVIKPSMPATPWQRMGLLGIMVMLLLLIVSSHPLTPWFLLMSLTALVALNRVTPRSLPILMVILLSVWLTYMAVAYLRSSHAVEVMSEVGDVSSSVSANVTERVRGDPEHMFIVYMRLVTTASIWFLAFLGGMRSLRRGDSDISYVLLMVTPFALLILQPYGGEMLLRVYLFTLPPTVLFTAALFYPTRATATGRVTTLMIGLLTITLLGGFLLSRYGDERIDNFTLDEVEALHYLYSIGEPESIILAATNNLPWKFQDYEKFRYRTMTREVRRADIDAIVNLMQAQAYLDAYLVLTRSQRIFVESFLGWPPSTWENFEQALEESGRFKPIFANSDAQIFVLIDR